MTPRIVITPKGWDEVTTRHIEVTFVSPVPFQTAALWLDTNARLNLHHREKRCPRCKQDFQREQYIYLIKTTTGVRVVCESCQTALIAAGFPTTEPQSAPTS